MKTESTATTLSDKVYWLILIGLLITSALRAQSYYSEGNTMQLTISTSEKDYSFETTCMSARLNNDAGRLEFAAPFRSFKSKADPTDLAFLKMLLKEDGQVIINSGLPYCDDTNADITYLRAFQTIQLPSEIKIGHIQMMADLVLCNIQIGELVGFDFDSMIDSRRVPADAMAGQKIREIRVEAIGAKLIKMPSM